MWGVKKHLKNAIKDLSRAVGSNLGFNRRSTISRSLCPSCAPTRSCPLSRARGSGKGGTVC